MWHFIPHTESKFRALAWSPYRRKPIEILRRTALSQNTYYRTPLGAIARSGHLSLSLTVESESSEMLHQSSLIIISSGGDFAKNTLCTNVRIWTPPLFASKLFDGDRDDCSRRSGLLSWHSLMPGHDGYSRTSTQTLLRALSTRTFTGLTGAGPTVSPSLSLLCNRY